MMEENGSKKVLLSVLGVAILVVAVVGISFAAFNATKVSDENTISTGTISMSYNEPTNGISITDALPMTEDTAVQTYTESGEVFEFTVSTNASGTLNVPYEINVTPVTGNTLTDEQVMVNLFKGDEKVVSGTLVSALGESTLRSGSKFVYSATDAHTAATEAKVTTYTLRMWINKDVDYAVATGKEYHLKVNVDAAIAPLA